VSEAGEGAVIKEGGREKEEEELRSVNYILQMKEKDSKRQARKVNAKKEKRPTDDPTSRNPGTNLTTS
jgi:hypothetical protein